MEITPQGSHQTQSILGCGGYSEQQQSKSLCHYHCALGLSNGLRAGKTATLTGPLATWLTQHPTAHLLFTKDILTQKSLSPSSDVQLLFPLAQPQAALQSAHSCAGQHLAGCLLGPASHRRHSTAATGSVPFLKLSDEAVCWPPRILKVNNCPLFHQAWEHRIHSTGFLKNFIVRSLTSQFPYSIICSVCFSERWVAFSHLERDVTVQCHRAALSIRRWSLSYFQRAESVWGQWPIAVTCPIGSFALLLQYKSLCNHMQVRLHQFDWHYSCKKSERTRRA